MSALSVVVVGGSGLVGSIVGVVVGVGVVAVGTASVGVVTVGVVAVGVVAIASVILDGFTFT